MNEKEVAASLPGNAPHPSSWLGQVGEMGKLIRSMNWSKTPLGPLDSWPQSLRTTVSLCLASNFPISIAWGPNRTQIYNDGYWPICGAKHPHSMGQDFKECWFSAWPAIGDAFERASRGETAFLVNQRMFLDRHGFLEETFFTFSFSPIRDETGGVAGLFHPVTELTQQSIAERRLQVLRDVADKASDAKSVSLACEMITHTLGQHGLDVPFALLYLVEDDCKRAVLAGSAGLKLDSVCPTIIDLKQGGASSWCLGEAAACRQIVEIVDVEDRLGSLKCGPYPERPHAAFVLPIAVSGMTHPIALLVVGASSRRPLDEPYRTFYAMLREAVTNALTNARTYEEERKRSEALAELDRAKTAFFSNVSHEFRTPLTLMLGPVGDILSDKTEDLAPRHRDRLEIVYRNSLRLQKLVNSLLDFSRIEAGRVQACYEPTDLAALTSELASNFRSACEKAGLKLIVDCTKLDEPVYVDRDMWEKITLNLLSNAFKYTLEGEIAICVHQSNETAELVVRDTGVGIPEEEMPKLFERFHRVEGTRGRTQEGSGIGLALVQELVRLHGGTVGKRAEI
jgi:signal transduction histidine kinase